MTKQDNFAVHAQDKVCQYLGGCSVSWGDTISISCMIKIFMGVRSGGLEQKRLEWGRGFRRKNLVGGGGR